METFLSYDAVARAIVEGGEDGADIRVQDHPELEILLPPGIEDESLSVAVRETFIDLLFSILQSTQRAGRKASLREKTAAALAHLLGERAEWPSVHRCFEILAPFFLEAPCNDWGLPCVLAAAGTDASAIEYIYNQAVTHRIALGDIAAAPCSDEPQCQVLGRARLVSLTLGDDSSCSSNCSISSSNHSIELIPLPLSRVSKFCLCLPFGAAFFTSGDGVSGIAFLHRVSSALGNEIVKGGQEPMESLVDDVFGFMMRCENDKVRRDSWTRVAEMLQQHYAVNDRQDIIERVLHRQSRGENHPIVVGLLIDLLGADLRSPHVASATNPSRAMDIASGALSRAGEPYEHFPVYHSALNLFYFCKIKFKARFKCNISSAIRERISEAILSRNGVERTRLEMLAAIADDLS